MAVYIGDNLMTGNSSSGSYKDMRIHQLLQKRPVGMLSNNGGIVSTPNTYTWNTSHLNYNNSGSDTTNNRWTAQEPGVYVAWCDLMTENNAYAYDYFVLLLRNGGWYPCLCYTSNGKGTGTGYGGQYHMQIRVCATSYMSTGDYWSIYTQYGHDMYGSNQRYSRLVVARLA